MSFYTIITKVHKESPIRKGREDLSGISIPGSGGRTAQSIAESNFTSALTKLDSSIVREQRNSMLKRVSGIPNFIHLSSAVLAAASIYINSFRRMGTSASDILEGFYVRATKSGLLKNITKDSDTIRASATLLRYVMLILQLEEDEIRLQDLMIGPSSTGK